MASYLAVASILGWNLLNADKLAVCRHVHNTLYRNDINIYFVMMIMNNCFRWSDILIA